MSFSRSAIFVIAALCSAETVVAGLIGQWDGSGTDAAYGLVASWNYPKPGPTYSTTEVHDLLTNAGSTIGPDAPITSANLALYDAFVIRIPAAAPTALELSLLSDWVSAGGLLLMFDDNSSNATPFNAILAGVGSTMSAGGSVDQNMYLVGGMFLTDSVAGSFLGGTPGKIISGGTALTRGGAGWTDAQKAQAASYIHYEQIGLGYVVAFGDLLDVNYFDISDATARGKMFLNVGTYVNPHGPAAPPVDPDPNAVPEPASWMLVGAGGALAIARRRTRD